MINKILSNVESFIQAHGMLDKDRPVLIGLSGGADSTALLDILCSLDYKCIAVHCNFKLRGDESIRDYEFSRMTAQNYGVEFHSVEFDTVDYAQSNGISIEMACRDLRYIWFDALIDDLKAQAIAVAHHKDDSVETLFLNLTRGTGITGLTGIRAVNGRVVRPMLNLTREEIELYLKKKRVEFIIDSSNKQDIYKRNKIRLNILPQLKQLNPSVTESITRTIANLQETEKIYRESIDNAKCKTLLKEDDQTKINIKELLNYISPQTLLFEILKDFNISGDLQKEIFDSLTGISGKQFFTNEYRILKDREYLIITDNDSDNCLINSVLIEKDVEELSYPVKLSLKIFDSIKGFSIPRDKNVACFDADKIIWPLVLRSYKIGDSFIPLGMNNYKKVSDFFSDNKVSIIDKEKALVLESDDKIIWLIGYRNDNRFRISDKTQRVLMISIQD